MSYFLVLFRAIAQLFFLVSRGQIYIIKYLIENITADLETSR